METLYNRIYIRRRCCACYAAAAAAEGRKVESEKTRRSSHIDSLCEIYENGIAGSNTILNH